MKADRRITQVMSLSQERCFLFPVGLNKYQFLTSQSVAFNLI